MSKRYVQYGCGLCAPEAWVNYDSSPTLRIQKLPVIGKLLSKQLNCTFPNNVRYGNIIKGLPEKPNSCDAVYCSHVLEHLTREEFQAALKNTYAILKPKGVFRCIVPDLEAYARIYLNELDGDASARHESNGKFMDMSLLGVKKKPKGIKNILSAIFGAASHKWMWDHASLSHQLEQHGFNDIRPFTFNETDDRVLQAVEEEKRFVHAVAIEAFKP